MFNLVLPTYNEFQNIIPCINLIKKAITKLGKEYKIIVVDDNSPDKTAEVAKSFNDKNIKVIVRPRKMGLGSAYIYAMQYCIYPYTIFLDCDLQHNPMDIVRLAEHLLYENSADIVVGSRFTQRLINGRIERGKVCGWSFYRKLQSSMANNIARYVLNAQSSDLTNSFRIYKTQVLKDLMDSIVCGNFGFQVEILARAEKQKYKIVEVPITFYDRNSGKSKLGIMEIFNFLLMICKLYFQLKNF